MGRAIATAWLGRLTQTCREAYGGLPRAAWLLALLELVNRSGMMVLFFFTLYMTRKLGFTIVQAGSVMSAYGIGSMLGTYLGGRLCDRLGAYHVQKLSLGGSALLLIVLQLPRSPWLLALLMLALAAASDALHPANAAATAQSARLSCGPRVSRCIGSPAIWASASVRWSAAISRSSTNRACCSGADGLTSLAGLYAGLRVPAAAPAPTGRARAAPAPQSRCGATGRSCVCCRWSSASASSSRSSFSTYPLYLRLHYGMPESGVGRLIAVNTLLDRHGRDAADAHAARTSARVIAIGTLLLGLGFGLTPFGNTTSFAVFSVVVWTFGEILTLPMLLTLTTLRSDPGGDGRVPGPDPAWRSRWPRQAGRCSGPGSGRPPDPRGCGTRARRSARRWRSPSHGCRANATPTRPRPPSWPRDGGLDAKSDGARQRFASAAADASA